MTSPDLNQLRDLVREMRDALVGATKLHALSADVMEDTKIVRQAFISEVRTAARNHCAVIARADAIIGPGDGFQEVERLNEGAENE